MAIIIQSIGMAAPLNATMYKVWQFPRVGETIRLKRKDGSIDYFSVARIEHPYVENNFDEGNIISTGDVHIFVREIR